MIAVDAQGEGSVLAMIAVEKKRLCLTASSSTKHPRLSVIINDRVACSQLNAAGSSTQTVPVTSETRMTSAIRFHALARSNGISATTRAVFSGTVK